MTAQAGAGGSIRAELLLPVALPLQVCLIVQHKEPMGLRGGRLPCPQL